MAGAMQAIAAREGQRPLSSCNRLVAFAGQPVDSSSLNLFRCLFGLLVFAESTRFFLHGWIDSYFLLPPVLFKYHGFEWVSAWPGNGLYWHFGLVAVLALMVALGLFYRLAIVGLTLGFGYVFLLDQSIYLNQYYLLLTLGFLLCFMPAERGFSLDTLRHNKPGTFTVPHWTILVLRIQFEIMLIWAGLVKLNPDWLQGEPLTLWLAERSDLPLVGSWLVMPGLGQSASIGVITLHLVGAPLLLLRKTRFAVFLLYLSFHLANSLLFQIGLFPWITLLGTLLFFEPDWPRQIWHRLQGNETRRAVTSAPVTATFRVLPVTVVVIAGFLALQIIIPMRGVFYPGRASWTGEGQWFAWRMKLDDKSCSGMFTVANRTTESEREIEPGDYLNKRQLELMWSNPDMVLQFAQFIESLELVYAKPEEIEVRADIGCSLNGRPAQLLIDKTVDLTNVRRSWAHYDWIQPL